MRLSSQRGILLPIALVLILALSASALASLILARTEALSQSGDYRHLRVIAQEEELLAGLLDPNGMSNPPVEGFSILSLPAGYRLIKIAGGGRDLSALAVYWALIPDSVAHTLLPGALEVGGEGIPTSGIRAMSYEEGCPPPYGRPLIQTPQSPAPPEPDPILPSLPRLGPLGVEDLIESATTRLPEEADFPYLPLFVPELFRTPPGTVIRGGVGGGLLLAEGDLRIAGNARFRGIVMVRGDLVMEESAGIEGVALVAGSAFLTGASEILGCPGFAGAALDHPSLRRLFPISGGELLGRF